MPVYNWIGMAKPIIIHYSLVFLTIRYIAVFWLLFSYRHHIKRTGSFCPLNASSCFILLEGLPCFFS
ncbi:hypothetical protein A7K93_01685 [Candidatus Methylacidiphilum fumarolicum]|nr:hypothetical protein A7K73_01645 [Candidatus Methylacidiphilum fumarolicum]TFE75223.1 hypothetical protein A7K93_01685 [Candidatus Methylacidiphilum fumarolicum]TFE76165.1 hypothetical protein A7K72_00490 [Candidatus Methylacidiphilum fumarolicum]TFE77312.1 hypothetical protein A7D33_05760 [Candidatus Methylacidiphilum fumarolicum]